MARGSGAPLAVDIREHSVYAAITSCKLSAMKMPQVFAATRSVATLSLLLVGFSSCNKSKSSDSTAPNGTSPQASSAAASLLEAFEGEIGILIKPGPQSHETKAIGPLNIQVKSGKVRIDAPSEVEHLKGLGHAYVVIAAPEKKIFAVLEDKKQIISLELDKLGERLKQMKPPTPTPHQAQAQAPAEKPPQIVKSTRADTVAGHTCYDWDIITEKGKASLCVAERGVPWLSMPIQNLPVEHAWLGQLLDGRHFPLRFVAYENGKESGRLEVTKLEQKSLPAQLFEAPAGYRTVELEQAIQEFMMAGMGAAGMRPAGAAGPGMLPPDIAARIKAAQEKRAKAH